MFEWQVTKADVGASITVANCSCGGEFRARIGDAKVDEKDAALGEPHAKEDAA